MSRCWEYDEMCPVMPSITQIKLQYSKSLENEWINHKWRFPPLLWVYKVSLSGILSYDWLKFCFSLTELSLKFWLVLFLCVGKSRPVRLPEIDYVSFPFRFRACIALKYWLCIVECRPRRPPTIDPLLLLISIISFLVVY